MSEEKKSKAEMAASLAKTEAETRQVLAEIEKVQAETRLTLASASKAELSAREEFEKRQKKEATDEENHLYRFAGEVSKSSVTTCMKRLTEWSRLEPKCNIEIIFSSPGGEIISGFELFDFIQSLRNSGHHITTGSLGYAASMAGILLQAGDTRWIGGQSWLMIHRAAFGAYGKTFEIEDEVEFVKRIEERILDIFTSRSKLSKRKIKRNWDRKDWWISADEAIESELVDEVRAKLPELEEKK
jgi:ATP-dependent Clp endopeptidase proteolytic subunit ClpP